MEPRSNISQPAFSAEREKAWLALLLGWIAGFADAFGYLVLNGVFTSHISGNSVASAGEAGRGHWALASQHAWPILFFVSGIFIGLVIETACARFHVRRRLGAALILEMILLLTFFFFGRRWIDSVDITIQAPARFYFLVAVLASAMGVQTAALRHVRGQSVHTSYVTGMLSHSVENAVKVLFAVYDRARHRDPGPFDDELKLMIFYGGLWLSFTVGAFCGGFGQSHWSFSSLLAPLGLLTAVIVLDLIRPFHES